MLRALKMSRVLGRISNVWDALIFLSLHRALVPCPSPEVEEVAKGLAVSGGFNAEFK
jgi:hypothetical protein